MMKNRIGRIVMSFGWLTVVALLLLLGAAPAQAVTYANTATTFTWIDASTHTKVGYNTSPYKFNSSTGCGTTVPILDDTLSDEIPIGFNFSYAGTPFTKLRIMTNGRLQFNNNTTCSFGSPVQVLPYPNTTLNYTMRIYGNDLDHTNKVDVPSYNTPCLSSATCYISYATIGTAPSRSFVVTWNNVPEWTTGNNPQGNYNLQVILQENGEFIYQYGTFTAGPSAALGQVGWQVDSTDYDTPQIGFPTANTALKFFIPAPVAEYRMEQTSWSDAAGQVIDTSGNARHATRVGKPDTIAGGRVCRAGDIPNNANTNTIDAINTGINVPTTVGNAGTITFWYRADSSWTANGTKQGQLLDASVVDGQWFFLTRLSSGALYFVVVDSGGNKRTALTSINTVAANTWKHIAVSWNFNLLAASSSDHLRIYLDGVLLKEESFTTSNVISSQIGTLYLGDNRSSFTETSGTGRSADGSIDEFRIYNYEGGSALVLRDFAQGSAGCLSHYAISHAGTGLTCQASNVTISAHDGVHGSITMPNNTTTITLSTSTGKGDWTLVNGYGVLNNGTADDGTATYLFNGEYQAVFSLSHTTAASVNINVTDGQFVEGTGEDPALVISSCLVNRFNACELATSRCVPSSSTNSWAQLFTKLADTAFKLDVVKLKTDGTLETSFNKSVTVDLLANSENAVALGTNNCPISQTATIALGNVSFSSGRGPAAGVSVSSTALSSVSPKYSAYRDVRVRFTCSAADCGSALTVCSTDNFAVRPSNFSIGSTMNNPAQTGEPRIKAGANFTLTSTAVAGYNGEPIIYNNSDNANGTKVYTHLGVSDLTNALSNATAASPLPLGAATAASGVASNAAVRYDDVGNFGILAGGVVDALYTNVDHANGDCVVGSSSNTADSFGKYGCNIANQSNTALFGRFYPAYYAVSAALDTLCPDFAWMGQTALGVATSVSAYSSNNVLLSRYTSGYATLASFTLQGDNNNGTTVANPLSASLSPAIPASSWAGGVIGRYHTSDAQGYAIGSTSIAVVGTGVVSAGAMVKFAGDSNAYTVSTGVSGSGTLVLAGSGLLQTLPSSLTPMTVLHSFTRPANSPVGPYEAFALKVSVIDSDNDNNSDKALISQLNGNPVTPADSVLFGSTRLRYGRMRIANAYGSEKLALPVSIAAQYWDGSKYVTNTLDSCTSLDRANFTLSSYTGGVKIENMSTAVNIPATNGVNGKLSGGVATIRLVKPSNPTSITTKGSFNLNSTIGWLPGLGRQTLGVYKNGPVIYIREVY
jgi:MSHA biogenesis protein MshQ